jgi:hypothetical protein
VDLAAGAAFLCLLSRRSAWSNLAAAIGCEIVAVFTEAGGNLVPIISAGLAVWIGRPKSQVAVLAGAAIVLLASYLNGYVTPWQHSDPLQTLLQPVAVAGFFAAEIGNPFGSIVAILGHSHRVGVAMGFGALGVAAFAVATLVLLRRGRAANRGQLLFFAIAGYTLGVCLLTALGRLKFGLEQALIPRYSTATLLFWLSMTLIAIVELDEYRPHWRLFAMALSLPCLLVLAWSQVRFAAMAGEWTLWKREAEAALLTEIDDAALHHLVADPALVKAQTARLRAQHLAMFAEAWSGWLGGPLADHVRLGGPGQCRGAIDEVVALSGAAGAGWRLSGWAWDNVQQAAADRIVLTDADGRVAGYALGGFGDQASGAQRGLWRGYAVADNADDIAAYALLDGGRTACPLGQLTGQR